MRCGRTCHPSSPDALVARIRGGAGAGEQHTALRGRTGPGRLEGRGERAVGGGGGDHAQAVAEAAEACAGRQARRERHQGREAHGDVNRAAWADIPCLRSVSTHALSSAFPAHSSPGSTVLPQHQSLLLPPPPPPPDYCAPQERDAKHTKTRREEIVSMPLRKSADSSNFFSLRSWCKQQALPACVYAHLLRL